MTDLLRNCAKCNGTFTARGAAHLYCSRSCQVRGLRSTPKYVSNVHVVIPDTQSKPGVPNDHMQWIGRYIAEEFGRKAVEKKINLTAVHLGDHWDFPSLSSYDRGKKAMEGRRVRADIDAGNRSFALLSEPWASVPARRVLLRGNHEYRVQRAIESDAQLDGLLSDADLLSPGWEVSPFLEVVTIDGVSYSHYFANPMTGRPYSGANIDTRLKTIGRSFTQGHQQTLGMAIRFVGDRSHHGLVCGACYQHDEEYLTPQGNAYWRGVVVCHDVRDGQYDIMVVSLDYLCRRFTGHGLSQHVGQEL